MVHFNQQMHLQLQENISNLKSELERKTKELEQYKDDKTKEADTTSTELVANKGIGVYIYSYR